MKLTLVTHCAGDVTLQPGTYEYNFQSELPLTLPSSLESDRGWVRYTATVVMDIPLARDDKFEADFTVLKKLNLNLLPRFSVSSIKTKGFESIE